jgi:hypothetical protein
MAEASAPRATPPSSAWAPVLVGAGLVYLALGVALAIGHFVVGIESSLFPTGWIYPLVLLVSGAFMALRRRFDLVFTVWAAFALAVFLLGAIVYVNVLELGVDDPTAFDASIIAAAFALVPLVLRPAFRD